MSDSEDTAAYRILFRTEGEFMNAYVGLRDTTEGAELIATGRSAIDLGRSSA